ncbi:MAG TPA: glycosyltransferase family 2 protein [bacterium]|nr:glycosyltransferase family 2 protein [bacterium]
MSRPVQLSVVIITFNEEHNLPRCLASLGDVADDLLVLDSHSTDRTRDIATAHGARIAVQPFLGYVAQKNRATQLARYDHVLQLDADEALTEGLRQEIQRLKASWHHAAYSIPRLTSYCGHWVRHGGWYPDRQTRLYDRRLGAWQGQLLHEHYDVAPGQTTGLLHADLLHYSYASISDHVRQLDRFTTLAAEQLHRRGQQPTWFRLLLKPWWKFIHGYFILLGFLDGFAGLSIAVLSAVGVFLKYAKLRALPHPASAPASTSGSPAT